MGSMTKAQLKKLRDYCEKHGVNVAQRKSDGMYCLTYGFTELDVEAPTLGELADKL